jgi:hypothetical protein
MTTLLSKLKEKSTWAGVATLIALTGWQVNPETFSAVSAVLIALIGLWEVLRKEK